MLFHGTSSAYALLIYRDGLLTGGTEGYRAHIHLVRGVDDEPDRQGIKKRCDAYVVVNMTKYLKELESRYGPTLQTLQSELDCV